MIYFINLFTYYFHSNFFIHIQKSISFATTDDDDIIFIIDMYFPFHVFFLSFLSRKYFLTGKFLFNYIIDVYNVWQDDALMSQGAHRHLNFKILSNILENYLTTHSFIFNNKYIKDSDFLWRWKPTNFTYIWILIHRSFFMTAFYICKKSRVFSIL